jgi:excisionase family DNA binding protein
LAEQEGAIMEKWYTVSEIANLTGRTRQTIYQQAKEGRLRPYTRKVSGKLRIKAEALELFSADRKEPGTKPEGTDTQGQAGTDRERVQHDQPGTSQDQPGADRDQLIGILLKEVETKNEQIRELQEIIKAEQSLRMAAERRILALQPLEAEKAENTTQTEKEPEKDKIGRSEGVPAATEEPQEPQKGWKMLFRRFRRP